MYKTLFKSIFTHLQAQVQELRWIAEDIGQLELGEEAPPVAFPCALISFQNGSYTDMGNMEQEANEVVEIRLGFNAHAETYAGAPESHLDASLERFEIEAKVVAALHGWEDGSGQFQSLSRISSSTERRSDGCKVRSLQFSTYYHDSCAAPVVTKEAVTIVITHD